MLSADVRPSAHSYNIFSRTLSLYAHNCLGGLSPLNIQLFAELKLEAVGLNSDPEYTKILCRIVFPELRLPVSCTRFRYRGNTQSQLQLPFHDD